MNMRLRTVHVAAFVAFVAVSAFDSAYANHYILPCTPECRAAGDVAIGPGFTGTWADPSQSGQTISIEVLPGQPLQMFALWFAFSPEGGQAWIMGRGSIVGTQAVLQATQTVGGGAQFPPNFDSRNTRDEAWGTLTFTFGDCEHGHVDWISSVAGYGSGGMEIVRVTLPAGLTCEAPGGGSATGTDREP